MNYKCICCSSYGQREPGRLICTLCFKTEKQERYKQKKGKVEFNKLNKNNSMTLHHNNKDKSWMGISQKSNWGGWDFKLSAEMLRVKL